MAYDMNSYEQMNKDARIAELEAEVKQAYEYKTFSRRELEKERDTLKARVAELEGLSGINKSVLYDKILDLTNERDELREKMEALKPKQPTIVKQTWQAIAETANANYNEHEVQGHAFSSYAIGYIRRDHYSDGTVKATLEKIGE